MVTQTRWHIAQYFEVLWWKRYVRKLDKIQYRYDKTRYWQQILSKLKIEIKPGDKALDAGCGPSGMYTVLSGQVDAVDPLLDKYENELGIFITSAYPNVRFIAKSFEEFESDKKYDYIFCMNALNHFHHLEASVAKLSSMLTKNGKLALSIDGHKFNLFKILLQRLPLDILHPYQYSVRDYKGFFKDHGLTLNHCEVLKSRGIFNFYLLMFSKNHE